MKESELSDEFRNRSNCWVDTEDAVQGMDEPTAIQFAKDYAAAQVAAKDDEIEGLKAKCVGSEGLRHLQTKEMWRLKADNARLREGISSVSKILVVVGLDPKMTTNSGHFRIVEANDLCKSLLSPADGDWNETPMVDENGLKPCPFCGSKADFLTFELGKFDGFEIRCSNQSCNAYKQTAPLNYWPIAQLERQKAKWNHRQERGMGK
jgi:hypothetical protein